MSGSSPGCSSTCTTPIRWTSIPLRAVRRDRRDHRWAVRRGSSALHRRHAADRRPRGPCSWPCCCATPARAGSAARKRPAPGPPARPASGWAARRSKIELVAQLVEHHLVMSDTAQKRDISDPRTVTDFATTIIATPERLRLLLVLTVADIRAVEDPGVWNGWKKTQLLRELYSATEAIFRGRRRSDLAPRPSSATTKTRPTTRACAPPRPIPPPRPGSTPWRTPVPAAFSDTEVLAHAAARRGAPARGRRRRPRARRPRRRRGGGCRSTAPGCSSISPPRSCGGRSQCGRSPGLHLEARPGARHLLSAGRRGAQPFGADNCKRSLRRYFEEAAGTQHLGELRIPSRNTTRLDRADVGRAAAFSGHGRGDRSITAALRRASTVSR